MFSGSSNQSKIITMKESPNLLLVFVSKLFFSFSSALLHGSILLLDSLKAFTMKLKKTMKKSLELFLAFVSKSFFSFSSALLHGPIFLFDSLKAFSESGHLASRKSAPEEHPEKCMASRIFPNFLAGNEENPEVFLCF